MKKLTLYTSLLLLGTVLSSNALAHPGHGVKQWEYSWLHYLLEPVHAKVGWVILCSILLAVACVRFKNWKIKNHRW